MGRKFKLCSAYAYLAVPSYAFCTLAAYALFPGSFSPSCNWLSELGNPNQNPDGAVLYNLGILLTGLFVLLFFLGLSRWKIKNQIVQNHLVLLTQIFGAMGSVALILSAVFPINHSQEHQVLSIGLYILLGTAFAFSATALRYHPSFPKWVMAVGLITAFVDILSGIYMDVTILEWLTVALFLFYLMLLNKFTRKLGKLVSRIPTSKRGRKFRD